MSEEAERKYFEAWAKSQNDGYGITKDDEGTYYKWQSEWKAFQAGIEFLRRNGEPVGYFHLHQYGPGQPTHEQVTDEYKDDEGVFPLFASPKPLPSADQQVLSNNECEAMLNEVLDLLKGKK
jgi:hypothetical protein